MSDGMALALSTMVVALIGMVTTLVTLIINNRNAKQIRAELKQNQESIEKTNTKVDEYHKETNSKLSQLVVAEKGVSFAEGKEQGRAQQIISDKDKQPVVNYDRDKPEEKTTGTGVKKKLDEAKENSQKTTDKIEQVKKKLDEI